jgi:hypothetical protein
MAAKKAAARKRSRSSSSGKGREVTMTGAPFVRGRSPIAEIVELSAEAGLRSRPGRVRPSAASRQLVDLQRRLERSSAHLAAVETRVAEFVEDHNQREVQERPFQRVVDERAKPCPFCGIEPSVAPWHGGPMTKRMIACDNDACDVAPSTAGDTIKIALERWNRRALGDNDVAMQAFGIMANVNGGNLEGQSQEWLEAFRRFEREHVRGFVAGEALEHGSIVRVGKDRTVYRVEKQ